METSSLCLFRTYGIARSGLTSTVLSIGSDRVCCGLVGTPTTTRKPYVVTVPAVKQREQTVLAHPGHPDQAIAA